jgi:hypothetical protein
VDSKVLDSSAYMHASSLSPKPIFLKTTMRKAQSTVLNSIEHAEKHAEICHLFLG